MHELLISYLYSHNIYIYIYINIVGGVRFKYKIELVGPFRGGGRASPHISPDLVPDNKGRRGRLPEEPKE